MTSGGAQGRRGDPGADQQRAAGPVQDLERPLAAEDAAGARGQGRIGEGVGESERQERRLEQGDLRQERLGRIQELRQEGDEEGQALRIEAGDEPGMAEPPFATPPGFTPTSVESPASPVSAPANE